MVQAGETTPQAKQAELLQVQVPFALRVYPLEQELQLVAETEQVKQLLLQG